MNKVASSRIHLLDELRGLCVLLMVLYHALYTLGYTFEWDPALTLFRFFRPVEPFFAGIFIALCGVSCRLSRNNLKRGVLLGAVAAGMSLVLWVAMPSAMIWFGVLHCLAVCIVLFWLCRPLLDRVPPLLGVIVTAVLFVLTFRFPFTEGGTLGIGTWELAWPREWMRLTWLFPLGIGRLYSADYFPLIPWLFCFLCGSFAGVWHDRFPSWCRTSHCRPLAFLGRHSLVIYLIHQPLIVGIGTVIGMLL